MNTLYLIPLALALLGCSNSTPRPTTLTSDKAGVLAQQLANEKAQALFNCQPFHNGPPGEFVQGHWAWHDLRGKGSGDFEAPVEFATDGGKSNVNVTRLDSSRIIPGF